MDILTLSMAKKYVDDTLRGMGALQGEKGDSGKSAYEEWLEQGNTGTEAEFLESLKGGEGFSPVVTVTDTDNGHKVSIEDSEGVKEFEVLDGVNDTEIIHTDLTGFDGITTVLDLVNALLEEYRTEYKNVRFESGNISNTILTDLPQPYGYLTIKVGGYDVVEVRFAHSNFGFKTMYYGYLNRTSEENLFSSLTWKDNKTTSHHRLVVQGTAGYAKIKAPNRDNELKITVTDNYGGSIEITGMATTNSTYKPFKVVRTSNGNHLSYNADDTNNNKLQKVYYYDGYLYVLFATYTTAIITGVTETPTVVETLENTDTEIPIIPLVGYGMKSYSSLANLGLDTTATIDDIVSKMADNSMFAYKTDVFDLSQYENLQYATVTILKRVVGRVQIFMTDKHTGDFYVAKMNAENTFNSWLQYVSKDYVDNLIADLQAQIDALKS